MTKAELRILTLLSNNAGRLRNTKLAPQMSRYTAADRSAAFQALELLGLISSAQVPNKRGPPGLVYWLTDGGKEYVKTLRSAGDIEKKGKRP